jgi:EpsI family protein
MDRTRAKIIASLLVTTFALAGFALKSAGPSAHTTLGLASARVPGESNFVDEPLDRDFLEVLRPREVLFRTYEPDAEAPVWVFLGYFDRQKEGSQVHSPRHCYPGSGWNIERELEWPASWRAGTLRSLVVNDGVERRLVCFWYQMPSGIERDVLPLKIALTKQAVLRRSQDVVFASVSTSLPRDAEEAFARAAPFVRAIESEIARLYAQRDESRTRHQ